MGPEGRGRLRPVSPRSSTRRVRGAQQAAINRDNDVSFTSSQVFFFLPIFNTLRTSSPFNPQPNSKRH